MQNNNNIQLLVSLPFVFLLCGFHCLHLALAAAGTPTATRGPRGCAPRGKNKMKYENLVWPYAEIWIELKSTRL